LFDGKEEAIMFKKRDSLKPTLLRAGVFTGLFLGFAVCGLLGPIGTATAQKALLVPAAPGSFAQLAKSASPSVVNINVVKVVRRGAQAPSPFGPNDPFREFFERFFGGQIPEEYKQGGLGTGFIIDTDGFILTNNHVVEGADEIRVTLANKREFPAKIVGRDPKTDLALVKIDSKGPLTPLPLGDSDRLEVGDWVVAIGNPFGLGNTVTAGIVSAMYRKIGAGAYDNFIQTDASINPGNSGGPLLNASGQAVGINSAIFSQSGGSVGIGFAIPINMAKDLLPQLKKGKVVRGWLGVMVQAVTPDLQAKLNLKDEMGALVADVVKDGPAQKAGIQRGDVIAAFDGKEIRESNDLPYLVASTPVGKTVKIEVMRKGKRKELKVRIEELVEEGQEPRKAEETKPSLGLTVQEITPEMAREYGLPEKTGILVAQIEDDSPAAEAGIRPGDIILEVDQIPVKTVQQFNRKVQTYKTGDTILLLIKREGAAQFMTMRVGK
jgi:serine protease Do